jgi:hypothetical protein
MLHVASCCLCIDTFESGMCSTCSTTWDGFRDDSVLHDGKELRGVAIVLCGKGDELWAQKTRGKLRREDALS